MAWTAPMTAVENAVWTSAQFNTNVRDNLNETEVAKALSGGLFVGTGANAIAERTPTSASVATLQSTTGSGGYEDLATIGPAVTRTTGTRALVWFKAAMGHTSVDTSQRVSVAVSGATTIAASDDWMIIADGRPASNFVALSAAYMFTTLNPGSNTFTMKYQSGTGGSYNERVISVLPL